MRPPGLQSDAELNMKSPAAFFRSHFGSAPVVALAMFCSAAVLRASDDVPNIPVWPALAPGEKTSAPGETLPFRKGEDPPVTRVVKIRRPSIDVFAPKENRTGAAVLILPGGGFGKVVTDKEGSEAAVWLNKFGIAAFVLRYRTNEETPKDEPAWRRPLQDAQRGLRLIRRKAPAMGLDVDRIGVLGFSAGGQVAAILHTREGKADYPALDAIDEFSCRPDFSLLVYPWNVLDASTGGLLSDIRPAATSPSAFIVHTHDDRSSSLGSVLIYSGLKKDKVNAELHIYENGGHGYGMREVKGSNIGSWPDRARDWLARGGFAKRASR